MPTNTTKTIDYPWLPGLPAPDGERELHRWLTGLADRVLEYVTSDIAGESSYAGVDVRSTVDPEENANDLAAEAEVESRDASLVTVRMTVRLIDQWAAPGGEGGGWEPCPVTVLATPANRGTHTTLVVEEW